jgi:predicted Zn-dependent protease
VRRLADTVQYWGERSLFGRDRKAHHFLRGLVLAAAGRHDSAVAEYRAAVHSWTLGYTRVNYELARCLLASGRPAEAVPVLQAALRGEVDAGNLYITRTELHELLGEAFARAGLPDSAAAHDRAVLRAWAHADPRFAPRREAVQRRLARAAR